MTANRDFKRLVRSRMTKTGESYTSARLQLLKNPAPPSPVPDFASLAGMSDAAIKKATGCAWDRWVWALDQVKANQWPHSEIALYVREKYKVRDWWTQAVTVGYERIKGLREKGQRRGGSFEASRSKTFPVGVSRLFKAWSDKKTRSRWLAGAELVIRTSQRNRSMRITWSDGTSVDLWFSSKGRSKSQVTVTHGKLASKSLAEKQKTYWTERLECLSELLTPAKARSAA